jgi:anti-anti-sigma factor
MLRVQTQQSDGILLCRLEGRFTGKGAEEVRTLITRCESNLQLVVDLTDVLFIDSIGEEVLLFVKRLGAQFIAETSYSRDVCERLQLSFNGRHKPKTQVPGNSNGRGGPRRRSSALSKPSQ